MSADMLELRLPLLTEDELGPALGLGREYLADISALVEAGCPHVALPSGRRFDLAAVREFIARSPAIGASSEWESRRDAPKPAPKPAQRATPSKTSTPPRAKHVPPISESIATMRANLTRARALADGASAELRAECDALVSQIEGELRANGVDVDDPRRAIAATKPPAAPAALRKEPPVSTKKTSNTDTPIVRAHATVNGCIQTFHVARSANDVLRETFATKQTALSAVHRAERHVEGCRENVRAYEAALRAAVEDVEIALEVANAHTALAGNVRRRIGHSTEYSPAKLAQLEAQAGESAAAVRTKRDAMNRAISQHEAAMSALRDAEKALVTARASAPR